MSRTFRRKGYEHQQRVSTYNGFGYYSKCDEYFSCRLINGHGGYPDFREMTKTEKDREYWRIHGESKHSFSWGPNKFCRKQYQQLLKTHNKREMSNYLKNTQDYEPQFLPRWVSLRNMWDW